MGVLKFSLPPQLPAALRRELRRAYVAYGPDRVPLPTQVELQSDRLFLFREEDDSGAVQVPWQVPGAGLLLASTATLIEREQPYCLVLELARGKITQVRNQAAEWQAGGLVLPGTLEEQLHEATQTFGRAATHQPAVIPWETANTALALAWHAAEKLTQLYADQVLHLRHQHQGLLETSLSCRLTAGVPPPHLQAELLSAVNTVSIPLSWREIEVAEGKYCWDTPDAVLAWAQSQGLHCIGGPLVDFSRNQLPAWLWHSDHYQNNFTSYVCDYVETAVKRYQDRIRLWQLNAAINLAPGLTLGIDELLWLTLKMASTVRRIDPSLQLIVGLAQPWGDYLAEGRHSYSPFFCADALLRNGLRLAALDLEVVMGITPRGSYCRGLLEISHLLDLYSLLGIPLQVTLGYPAARGTDPLAEPDLCVDAGYWRAGIEADSQAEWAAAVAKLALAKPYVRSVNWVHFADAAPHQFPHSGLVDPQGRPRPALDQLRRLRQQHLK